MYPFGPFGNMMPYSNFHGYNLDWIISCVKENNAKVADFAEDLEAMDIRVDEFQAYIDSLDDTIQQKIDEELPAAIEHEAETGGFNGVLSLAHKRRVVCFGDSYGDGWTPDGSYPSWITKLQNILGIANEDFCSVHVGGTGFGKDSSIPAQYLPNMIQTAYETISNPITVTDIIFGLGYNDYLYADTPTRITDGIGTCVGLCKQKFPNARIHIYAIGFTTNTTVQNALTTVYNYYSRGLYDYQFSNMSDCLSEVYLFSTDGIHPLESGQYAIAQRMASVFNNSTDYINYGHDMAASELTFEMIAGGTQDVSGWLGYARKENGLYLTNTTGFKNITPINQFNITGGTMTKIAKLKSSPYTGYHYPRPYITTAAMLYYRVSGSNDYHDMPVAVTLSQDLNNNDHNVYLWIKTEGMDATGFKGISNITLFGLSNVCVPLPFIGNY